MSDWQSLGPEYFLALEGLVFGSARRWWEQPPMDAGEIYGLAVTFRQIGRVDDQRREHMEGLVWPRAWSR